MIKIKKSRLIKYLLLFPIMKPGILSQSVFQNFNDIYSVFRILVFLILIYMLFFKSRSVAISKFAWATCLYHLYIFLVTLFTNPQGIAVWAGPATAILTVVLLFEYYANELYELIECIGNILFILFFVNEISVIVCLLVSKNTDIGFAYFNSKISSNQYFLGMDNRFINYFFPAILCNYITEINSYKNDIPKTKIILIIGTITLIVLRAVGGMFGMILLSICVLLNRFNRSYFVRIWLLIALSIVLSVSVVMVGCVHPEVLVDFFQHVALKGSNFFDRVRMWRGVYSKVIVVRPWTGIGVQSLSYMKYIMHYNHAHNLIMTLMLQGGIVGELLWWISIFIGTKNLNMANNTKLVVMTSACIIIELLTNIMDTTNDAFFFLMICIAANIVMFERKTNYTRINNVYLQKEKCS